jgi:anti-sigma factor RsiW
MNLDADEISLAHVHAYVDAQLNDDDCERLEDYFDINPDKFDQLQRFLAINDHCQSLYDPVLSEPIPQRMLERIYGENIDPFQSPIRDFSQVSKSLSSLLFEKPSAWTGDLGQRLYELLRINRLNDEPWFFKPWLIKLRSMISMREGQEEGTFIKFFKVLKLHPQTAPTWINQFVGHTSALLAKPKNSLLDVNLFAAAVIVSIGIAIGTYMHSSADAVVVVPTNQGYAEAQAIQAHLFYRKEGRFVLEADQEKQLQLLNWVSGRLGKEIRLIDFSEMGYSNAGVMLVPAVDNFAMVTVYEDDQSQKLTLYVGLRDAGNTDDIECVPRENTKSLCSWANGELQFVVVSDLPVAETRQLTEWMKQNYAMAHLISSNEYFFSHTLGTINA